MNEHTEVAKKDKRTHRNYKERHIKAQDLNDYKQTHRNSNNTSKHIKN